MACSKALRAVRLHSMSDEVLYTNHHEATGAS